MQLTVKRKAAPQRSISAVAVPPALEASQPAAEQAPAAGKVDAPPRRLVTAVREKAHEKVAVPFVPVTLVCKNLRYYVPGGWVGRGFVAAGDAHTFG